MDLVKTEYLIVEQYAAVCPELFLSPPELYIWVGPAVIYYKMLEVVHSGMGMGRASEHELAA